MTGRDPTVLVLGAYGQAGRAVVAELRAATGLPILAAGRDEERLRALASSGNGRVQMRRVDLGDRTALRQVCGEARVVINCVGPYLEHGERAARAALEAGTPYVDVASEQEHFRRLLKLDAEARRAGIPIVTGAGLYPGISGMLLAALRSEHPAATRAEVLLAVGRSSSEDVGSAALVSALYELHHPLEVLHEGRLRAVDPGAAPVRRNLPAPFGMTDLIPWPQLEILAAARHENGIAELSTCIAIAGFGPLPPVLLSALRRLDPEHRPWIRRLLRGPARWLHRRAFHSPEGQRLGPAALVAAELTDAARRHRITFAVRDGAAATAWLPALLAERLLRERARGGVYTPMDLLGLEELVTHLRARGARFEMRSEAFDA